MRAIITIMMMAGFFVIGCSLFWSAVRQSVRRRTAIQRMQPLQGTVLNVMREYRRRPHSKRDSSARTDDGWDILNYPVIRFRTPSGEEITFRSESGDMGRKSQYRPGQQLEVLYDPTGEAPPIINSWSATWFEQVSTAVAGLLFVGCSVVMWLAFGDRILASF